MEAASSERARSALALLATHEATLRRCARRVSICDDDAEEALARAVEILLTKAPPLERRRLAAWMTVVTRREALAVRRSRERLLGLPRREPEGEPADFGEVHACERPGPLEQLMRRERVTEAWRALAELKANERLAILLQAQGFTYAEIGELCGWTYTKVNRCLAEGRARLRLAAGAPPPPPDPSPRPPLSRARAAPPGR